MAIKIYFGVPGSGKTTNAARIVLNNLRKGITTYSNVPIKGAVLYDPKVIGQVDISKCDLIIDEAGIHYNNRKFKTLPQEQIEWFKLSRHYGVKNIHIFSQSYDDMDITLRRLADEIYIVKRTLIPYLFMTRRIYVKVGIDKDTHQIMDMYFFRGLGITLYFGFRYWHMFDSYSKKPLPQTQWKYSSYDDFTIDKKHSKLIYRSLHKQGKLLYKLFQLSKSLVKRLKEGRGKTLEVVPASQRAVFEGANPGDEGAPQQAPSKTPY